MVCVHLVPLISTRLCGWFFCCMKVPIFANVHKLKGHCSQRRHRVLPRELTRRFLMIFPRLESWLVFLGILWSVLLHGFSFPSCAFVLNSLKPSGKAPGGRPPKSTPRPRGSRGLFGTHPTGAVGSYATPAAMLPATAATTGAAAAAPLPPPITPARMDSRPLVSPASAPPPPPQVLFVASPSSSRATVDMQNALLEIAKYVHARVRIGSFPPCVYDLVCECACASSFEQ